MQTQGASITVYILTSDLCTHINYCNTRGITSLHGGRSKGGGAHGTVTIGPPKPRGRKTASLKIFYNSRFMDILNTTKINAITFAE